MVQTARYGEWKSPITSEFICASSIKLGQVECVWPYLYVNEVRPQEKGRYVVVRCRIDSNAPYKFEDVTPANFNARTLVHEYGGTSFKVQGNQFIYFSNFTDQRLYKQKLPEKDGEAFGEPIPLTPESESRLRFTDYCIDENRGRIVCVAEQHPKPGEKGEARNFIASISYDVNDKVNALEDNVITLVEGSDFYTCPRLNSNGKQLSWVCWEHPNMPWDDTALYVGNIDETSGEVGESFLIAGGHQKGQSITEPVWSPKNPETLYFVCDKTNWWNIYKTNTSSSGLAQPLDHTSAVYNRDDSEFSGPHWMFGMTNTYHVFEDERILCKFNDINESCMTLAMINGNGDNTNENIKKVSLPVGVTNMSNISVSTKGDDVFIASGYGGSTIPTQVGIIGIKADDKAFSSTTWTSYKKSMDVNIDPKYLSSPSKIKFKTDNDQDSYMVYYPPKNDDFAALKDTKPPVIIRAHGGPTGFAVTQLNLMFQYFTSRGFAICDVDYGGSAGYGRKYRQRLNEKWGIVDVCDSENAAKYLIENGSVDKNQICIAGGSAGGYTTLACLAFTNTFSCGTCSYGVASLELLMSDTHKFESRYINNLVGPYPECKERYIERAPIHSLSTFNCPVIFFHGTEDKVVPVNQAELMYAELKKKKLPTSLVLFEGEQHGWRQSATIKSALDGELYFYGKVLGFKPEITDPDFKPPEIVNL